MPGDFHWGWVKAGLHLDGTNGSTSFPEVRGRSVAAYGSPVISTAQNRYTSEGSLYLNGSSYIEVATSSDFLAYGGSLAISWSMYVTQLPPSGEITRFISLSTNDELASFTLALTSSGSIWAGRPQNGTNAIYGPSQALNVWKDHEVSVFNGRAFWFADGTLVSEEPSLMMPTVSGTLPVKIGRDLGGPYSNYKAGFFGYISNVRIATGSGRHVASYTPDTGPFVEELALHSIRADVPQPMFQVAHPSWRSTVIQSPFAGRDMEHGGIGRVVGNTKNVGAPDYPVARRVRLLRKRDGVLARETWSDLAGNFEFRNVRHDIEYMLVSHDHTGLYNGVISDLVTPDIML